MAWMPKSEAAAVLGLSPLVLSRQIAVGRFRTKTVGRKVLVDIGDAEKRRGTGKSDPESQERPSPPTNLPYESPTTPEPKIAKPAKSARQQKTAKPKTEKKDNRVVADPPRRPLIEDAPDFARDGQAPKKATGDGPLPSYQQTAVPIVEEPVTPSRPMTASLHEEEILTATLEAVDKVRAYCDQESSLARVEAEQAWSACDRAERRLRRVAFVAAVVLVGAIGGVGWLDSVHTAERTQWETRIEEAQNALAEEQARQQGEADSIRAAFDAYRMEAEQAREKLQEALTNSQAQLAMSQNENDHICWERDEAMHARDRLANEVAAQRNHIENLQGLQANTAAKSLRDLLEETWDTPPPSSTNPPVASATPSVQESPVRLTVRP